MPSFHVTSVLATVALCALPLFSAFSASAQEADLDSCIRGDRAFEVRAYQNALDHYSDCLALAGLTKELRGAAYNNRAHTRIRMGDIDGALQDFQAGIDLLPEEEKSGESLARGWIRGAPGVGVLLLFDRPQNRADAVAMRVHLGRMVLQKSLANPNWRSVEDRIANNPNDAQAYAERASMFKQRWDFERALNDINRALSLEPGNVKLLQRRSYLLRRLGDRDGAIADLEQVVEIDPTELRAYIDLAIYYHTADRPEEAIAAYSKVLAADPEAEIQRERRGDLYFELQEYENAAADYERLVETARADWTLFEKFGIALCRSGGDPDRVIELLKQVRQRNPSRRKRQQEVYQLKGFYSGPVDGKDRLFFRLAERLYVEAACPKLDG